MRRSLILALVAAAAAGCASTGGGTAVRHFTEGQDAYARGDLDAALADFEAAIQADSSLAAAYAGVGDVFRKQGRDDKAIEPYKRAARLMPREFTYHYRLGRAYQAVQHHDEAAATYERAVDLDATNAPVRINLGVVYYRLAMAAPDDSKRQTNLAKAQRHGERAIQLDPTHGYAWSNLGAVYDAQGESYRAIQAYHKALSLDQNQGPVRVNLGMAYLRQGRIDQAIEALKEAARLAPGQAVVHRCLGYAYSKKKQYGAAIEEFQTVLDLNPDDWKCRNSLAAVYMIFYLKSPQQDRLRQQAVEQWHRSLEANADQPNVRAAIARWGRPPQSAGAS